MTPVSSPDSSTQNGSAFHLNSILLPTDFSDASDRAAYLARQLVKDFHARLYMVHAVWQKDYPWDEKLFQHVTIENLGRKLTEEFVLNHELDVLPHEILVRAGWPADVVRQIADENHIDLIVLGTNGLKGAAKLLFGTYSEQIYRNVTCPVLTVGPHVNPAKCSGIFHSIVFAMNPESPGINDALRYAVILARTCGAHLTVANILPESHGLHGEALYKVEEEKRAQISAMLAGVQLALPHEPEIIVQTGHISEEIIKLAVGRGADLIVKGIRTATSHPSQGRTYPISVNAHCPVLTVAGKAQPAPA